MGVDLDLLPYTYEDSSHTLLNLERRSELWPEIKKLWSREASEKFMSFRGRPEPGEDNRFWYTTQTPYGNPVRYTQVKHLLTLHDHPAVRDNPTNRAVWAYLAELPSSTKVALYWH